MTSFEALSDPSGHADDRGSTHRAVEVSIAAPATLSEPQARASATGSLPEVPMGAGIKLTERADGAILLSWPQAGRMTAYRGRDHLAIELSPESPDGAWMVGCLLGSLHHVLGHLRGIHGALVEVEGRRVLVCGGSGSGKSTLALLAVCYGGHLLVEDFCYMNASGHVGTTGIRDFITLRQGTWNWLGPRLRPWLRDGDPVPESTAAAPIDNLRNGRTSQVRLMQSRLPARAVRPTVPVDAVILSSIDPDGDRLAGSVVDHDIADATISRTTDDRFMSWMKPLLSFDSPPNAVVLPERVAFLQVSLGINADPSDAFGSLRDILDASVNN